MRLTFGGGSQQVSVSPQDPGAGNLLVGYLLLGLQPLPVALLAAAGWHPAESVFARFGFACIVLVAICLLRRRGLTTGNPKVLFLRGLFGAAAVLLYFTSISDAGAARGTLLNYTYPIWANLIAWALGTRPVGRFWFALAIAGVGVWLVVVPEGGLGARPIGWGEWAGILSAMLAGAAVVTIKKLRETDESLTIVAGFSVFGALLASFFVDWGTFVSGLQDLSLLGLALSIGVLSFVGHVFFTRGYRGTSIAQATLLSLSVPVVAALAGVLFLEESLTPRFLVGAAFVVGSLLIMLPQKRASKT